MLARAYVAAVVEALLTAGAARATKFVSDVETVTAKWVMYRGKIDKRSKRTCVVLSFGRPNYAEREFIRKCRKAGEPFPVKRVQLKFPRAA